MAGFSVDAFSITSAAMSQNDESADMVGAKGTPDAVRIAADDVIIALTHDDARRLVELLSLAFHD